VVPIRATQLWFAERIAAASATPVAIRTGDELEALDEQVQPVGPAIGGVLYSGAGARR